MSQYIPYPDITEAHDRSREWWESILGRAKNPQDATEYIYARRQRTGDPEADSDLPDGVDAAIVVAERDAWLDTLVADDAMQPHEAAPVAPLYPAWAAGVPYAVGDILSYNGDLYKVRQAHTSQSDWQPTQVPVLFIRYRADADTLLSWIAWEQVALGYQRTYEGVTYECIQAHVTQDTWQPPNVPALWQALTEPTEEWAAGVAYTIGDVVTYQGSEYQCRQSHTSLVGWEPPNVPALWQAL